MRGTVRILGFVLVAVLAIGLGLASAQEKSAGQAQEKKEAAPAADPLTGTWEGTVDTPNGVIAFTLTVTLDKENVSGQIASSEGAMPVAGTWVDGKLSASFDYNGGPMGMNGALKDGALAGEMIYGGGEAVMPWTAKKRTVN